MGRIRYYHDMIPTRARKAHKKLATRQNTILIPIKPRRDPDETLIRPLPKDKKGRTIKNTNNRIWRKTTIIA